MGPKEDRDAAEGDLFRAHLETLIDPGRELVKLARTIEWARFDEAFGGIRNQKQLLTDDLVRLLHRAGIIQQSEGAENHHRALASSLQCGASAFLVGLQTASAVSHSAGRSRLRILEAPAGLAFRWNFSFCYMEPDCVLGVGHC